MRTVLIGSDFMYDSNGNLKLLEINTNITWEGLMKVEETADIFDLTGLDTFVKTNNFSQIHYVGDIVDLSNLLKSYCDENSLLYSFYHVGGDALTVPYIEDAEDILIIRSAYDTTALVDDTYCADKINFMNLIKNESFGSQFAVINDNNILQNNITEIIDNGIHPNFILKASSPHYDVEVYPKVFKVTNQTELDTLIANNVTNEYFLMPFYLNTNKTYNGHLEIIRSYNLLVPPNLESIQIGQYTKLNENILLDNVTYNETTFEIDAMYRDSYVSVQKMSALPKVLDTDLIEMADGTFKTPAELVVGDLLKTIDIPNPNNEDTANPTMNYGITYDTFIGGTNYSSKPLLAKKQINSFVVINTITFDDDTNWYDAEFSSYLINRNDNIQFETLMELKSGDIMLLIDSSSETLNIVEKTIKSTHTTKQIFSGWELTVEIPHLFLTKNPESTVNANSYVQYVAVQHNAACPYGACSPCSNPCASCLKPNPYCAPQNVCVSTHC
jgi:hypothetical protein